MERLQITEQDVRDYCFLRMPESSALYAVLHEEFTRDPVNSRVGQFCRETERVVRRVMGSDLDWESLYSPSEAASETGEVSDEFRDKGSVESSPSKA